MSEDKKDENISNENIKNDVNTIDNCFDFCIESYVPTKKVHNSCFAAPRCTYNIIIPDI